MLFLKLHKLLMTLYYTLSPSNDIVLHFIAFYDIVLHFVAIPLVTKLLCCLLWHLQYIALHYICSFLYRTVLYCFVAVLHCTAS